MLNYKIDYWQEQKQTLWGRVTLPVRRWVMTPEDEIGLRSWALVTLALAIIAAALFVTFGYELMADMLATQNGWAAVTALIFFDLFASWGLIHMIKIDTRRWLNFRDAISGYNDETTSNGYTVKIINQAKNWLLLYDYGEDDEDNIYHSPEVQQALLAKLQDGDVKFEVSMVFKKDQESIAKLPLVQALKQWQREHPASNNKVYFTYGVDRADDKYKGYNWHCQKRPFHYKINDRGYAYLTTHSEGEIRRRFVYAAPLAVPSLKDKVNDCLGFHNAAAASN